MPDLNSSYQLEPASGYFECDLRSSGRAETWIRACGELDRDSAPRFEQALQAAFSCARLVIVDLRRLSFIDSTGLRLIVEADTRARRARRRIVFVRGPAPIDRLFNLVGLSDRLEIVDLKPFLVSAGPLAASVPPDAA